MAVPFHIPPGRAEVLEVVHVEGYRGDGSPMNPERLIALYFSRDGKLLACHDPLMGPPDSFSARLAAAGVGGGGRTHLLAALELAQGWVVKTGGTLAGTDMFLGGNPPVLSGEPESRGLQRCAIELVQLVQSYAGPVLWPELLVEAGLSPSGDGAAE